ncbi:hypothetical protein [Rhizobium terrae]|uniref:hypothetical protein n=1 Tax=Rhizobium terrae TaxID=2171756 RepID=UPI0013C2F1D2|nr:hypothetical protein [Rhizobium terrae]
MILASMNRTHPLRPMPSRGIFLADIMTRHEILTRRSISRGIRQLMEAGKHRRSHSRRKSNGKNHGIPAAPYEIQILHPWTGDTE